MKNLLGIVSEKTEYDQVQALFMNSLLHEERLFNEYHALLVQLEKTLCNKNPKCDICPLKDLGARQELKAKR